MTEQDSEFIFDLEGHVFERELQDRAPRAMPAFVWESRYDRSRLKQAAGWFIVGACSYALSALPFVRSLSYNLLPLGYLHYIGLACIAVAVIGIAGRALRLGHYRYIKRGLPLAAGIVLVEKIPLAIVNGVPATYGFAALVEAAHPDTGEIGRYVVKSPGFSANKKDLYTTPLQPGQTVTALYLPGRFPKSLQLYGFLGLNPDLDFVQRIEPDRQGGLLSAFLKGLGVCLFFAALFWNVYALDRYWPLDAGGALPIAVGLGSGILGFLLMLAVMLRAGSRPPAQAAQAESAAAAEDPEAVAAKKSTRRQEAIALVLVPLVIGSLSAFTGLNVLFAVNALPDRSDPVYELVRITDLTETTYNFVYRIYKIEYEYPAGKTRNLSTTYERIMAFEYDLGAAEVHQGYLGWPWIKEVYPVRPVPETDGDGQFSFEIVGRE